LWPRDGIRDSGFGIRDWVATKARKHEEERATETQRHREQSGGVDAAPLRAHVSPFVASWLVFLLCVYVSQWRSLADRDEQAMKIGVFAVLFGSKPFEETLDYLKS